MIKTLLLTLATILAIIYAFTGKNHDVIDDRIIINRVMDAVYKKQSRPNSVFVGEQIFYSLDRYLASKAYVEKEDSLALLILGDWSYLRQKDRDKYSKKWNRVWLDKVPSAKYGTTKNADEQDRFSPVSYSSDGKRAFVIYTRTVKNVTQSTVFFFFEKKESIWLYKSHFVPFLD